jgi:hypothetical protein
MERSAARLEPYPDQPAGFDSEEVLLGFVGGVLGTLMVGRCHPAPDERDYVGGFESTFLNGNAIVRSA